MAGLYWLKRPIAHRGLHDAARGIAENSASSVRAAIGAGFAIEVDLQCTADHLPIVFHDATLDRLTAASGPVAALSAEALAKIPLRDGPDFILSFPALLALVNGHVPLILEVKSTWTRAGLFERNIAAMLAPYPGPVAVMSFDPYCVSAFRDLAPNLPRGLIAERFDDLRHWPQLSSWQRFQMRHLLTAVVARPDFIAYDIKALPAVAPLIARFLFGLPLLTWTVRCEEERERAMRYADAMIFERIAP
ncbi:MAG TPA: glycerophosphodiester phosphodiesterase family protein [Methyloceanibacter sp.]|nr:glycerophosphodiester phosphodiesterase family protein [Methyloceanibacter sp.]